MTSDVAASKREVSAFEGGDRNDWVAPPPLGTLTWDSQGFEKSLNELYGYAVARAQTAIDWYRRKKRPRQTLSLWIRFVALCLIFFGGLCPLVPSSLSGSININSYGYLLLAAGGGLVLFDKLFGVSSAWMRFMSTAQELEAQLDAFRVEWSAQAVLAVKREQQESRVDPRFELIQHFLANLHAAVGRETNEWKTEFNKSIVYFSDVLVQSKGSTTSTGRR